MDQRQATAGAFRQPQQLQLAPCCSSQALRLATGVHLLMQLVDQAEGLLASALGPAPGEPLTGWVGWVVAHAGAGL